MYPYLSDILNDLFGIDLPFDIYSFGAMVAIGALTAGWLLGKELDRYYKMGMINGVKMRVDQKPKKSKMPPKRNAPPKPVHTTPKNLKKINTNVIDTSANTLNLSEGMMVNHQKFGNGIIESLDNGKATINFQNIGNKQLLLKFAKLTIVK